MEKTDIKNFQETIYSYYRKNKRDLPWRSTQNPYHIFVSEVMLQQTQVNRVVEKYKEFIEVFADFKSLAHGPLSKILKTWQGLGYNRRAIYLHESAKMVVKKYKGQLPAYVDKLIELPGVGCATASAICTFAFNSPVVFVETNIRSVYLHYFFNDEINVGDKRIIPLIKKTLDWKNPREWYFALMDYGTMLKNKYTNPSRQSTHYIRQSSFSGSNRQLRGEILRILLLKGTVRTDSLIKSLNQDTSRILRLLQEMETDGFMKQKGDRIMLLDQKD